MLTDLTYIVVVVLVPIIPAFLLYKNLPEREPTTVGGIFQGLDIRLKGAFAGYFIVFLATTSMFYFLIKQRPAPQEPQRQYEVYTVRGKIDLQKTGDQQPRFDYRQLSFALNPSQQQVVSDGSFALEIPVKRKQNGQLDFPTLSLEYADPEDSGEPYEVGTIHLAQDYGYQQDFKATHDPNARTIDVKPDIPLVRRGYRPNRTAQPYNPKTEGSP